MLQKEIYSKNQLRDYSSLFSRSAALSWMRNDFSSIDCKIGRYDKYWSNTDGVTYIEYLKFVYSILERHYQNEYVVKNSLLNEWLIKEMGQSNSKVFNEFRVGNAVADLVMFNGNSRVFEIKTELDSEARLPLQIENYRKAFNQIFLVIPEDKLNTYKKINAEIGLITMSGNKDPKFILQRDAVSIKNIDADTIMNILYTHEYKKIIKSYFGCLPEMTSFNQFNKCNKLIKEIPNHELNKIFIEQMKKRDTGTALSYRYYKELNQLILALKLSKPAKKNLIKKLQSPIKV